MRHQALLVPKANSDHLVAFDLIAYGPLAGLSVGLRHRLTPNVASAPTSGTEVRVELPLT